MMDATEPDRGPTRDDFSPAAIFCVVWILVGSFFALHLFVGVVVDSFSRIKTSGSESATMTADQQQWVETMKVVLREKPPRFIPQLPPRSVIRTPIRREFHKLVTDPFFERGIIGAILLNVLVMSCYYRGLDDDTSSWQYVLYTRSLSFLTSVFYAEAVSKILGLGASAYFGDGWCRFDFSLVLLSLLHDYGSGLAADFLPIPPMLLRTLRVLRVLRILRLLQFQGAKQLRNLIMTLVLSLPALFNVCGMVGLFVFIYSILGTQLFTFLVQQTHINAHRNFQTAGSSALVLFQCMTGDGWSLLMRDAMVHQDSGDCSDADGNCGSLVAIPYFVSFQILTTFVFLSLIVAVILENFTGLPAAMQAARQDMALEAIRGAVQRNVVPGLEQKRLTALSRKSEAPLKPRSTESAVDEPASAAVERVAVEKAVVKKAAVEKAAVEKAAIAPIAPAPPLTPKRAAGARSPKRKKGRRTPPKTAALGSPTRDRIDLSGAGQAGELARDPDEEADPATAALMRVTEAVEELAEELSVRGRLVEGVDVGQRPRATPSLEVAEAAEEEEEEVPIAPKLVARRKGGSKSPPKSRSRTPSPLASSRKHIIAPKRGKHIIAPIPGFRPAHGMFGSVGSGKGLARTDDKTPIKLPLRTPPPALRLDKSSPTSGSGSGSLASRRAARMLQNSDRRAAARGTPPNSPEVEMKAKFAKAQVCISW